MGSFYDDLAAQDSGTPAPAAPSFYDQLKSQDEEQGRLRVSVDSAMATTPEKAAKQKYLSLVTGLPESVVSTEEGEAQARAKVIEIQREAQFSPVLQAKLQDPKFTALALEDVSPLSKIEKGLRKFFDGGAYKQEAAYAAKVAGATAARTLGGATVGVGASAFDAEAVVFDWLSGLTKGILPVDIPGQIAASARGQANAARDSLDFFLPKAEGNLEAGLYSGGQSLGFNLATLPLAAEAAAAKGAHAAGHVMGMVAALATGAQTYNQGRDAGMGQIGAATFAAPAAMAEYLFEKWSGGKFFDDIAAKSGALKMLFNNATREVIGENATTLTQNFNEWLRLNPEKTVREFVAEQPDAMIQTTIAALVGAGGMTGAVKLMQQFGDVSVKQEDAQRQHALLQGIMQTAAGSKLRELDPDTFSRFVQDAANGTEGAPTSMFVDGNTLAEVLNQAGVTDEQLAQVLPSVSSQLADALSMNSAVEIPIGELATALPGTPLEQAILPHLRTSEDAPSQREAQQAQANAQEFLQTSAQRVIDQAADGVKAAASAEAVRKTMFDQLMATGRMSEDVASKNATLVREWYTVMSSMLGTTPEELYKAMPYTVQGAGQRGALTQERAAVTDTPEFKTWFGDSKVVDAEGKPLVVYHGTKGDFDTFEVGRETQNSGTFGTYTERRLGIFLAENSTFSTSFAVQGDKKQSGANVMPVYLDVKNPLDLTEGFQGLHSSDFDKLFDSFIKNNYWAVNVSPDEIWSMFDKGTVGASEFVDAVKAAGFDGAKIVERDAKSETTPVWVVFNPTQIKSATGNNGNFDGTDPNILRQSTTNNGDENGQSDAGDRGVKSGAANRVIDAGINFVARIESLAEKHGRVYIRWSPSAANDLTGNQTSKDFVSGATHSGLSAIEITGDMHPVDIASRLSEYGFLRTQDRWSTPHVFLADKVGVDSDGYASIKPKKLLLDSDSDVVQAIDSKLADIMDAMDNIDRESKKLEKAPGHRAVIERLDAAKEKLSRLLPNEPVGNNGNFDGTKASILRQDVQPNKYQQKYLSGRDVAGLTEEERAQYDALATPADLQQPQAQGPRGTFNPATLTTVLNENADLSTFLHETGHFFHEALMQLASQPDAPQEVKDLAAKALKVFGIKDIETWNAMDLEAKRPHYERFAETFELYLMTGKAPNVEIAGLFRTFRAWLTRVYKSLESFAQSKGITLDKDLTDVMDRMLATEAQIAEAEKVAGMVPELNATGEAIEQLQARSIRDLKWAVNARDKMIKALQKEAATKRKEVEEEVTAEVDATPEMRAKKALDALRVDPDYTVALKTWNDQRAEQLKQNQETLESELRAANPDVKGLAKGQLMVKNKRQIAANAELRTLEWEKQNPKPKRPVNVTDADVATVADSFGYESPEAMVQAIDAYGPRDVAIEGIADQRMLERYGDLTDPAAIAAAATEAVHNQARAKSLATELAAQREMLNKRDDTGKTNAKGQKVTVNALMEAAKQFAANVIGRRQIGDLKKAANSHLQAERRAAKAWEAATAKGDTQAAVQAKQDQVLNNAAVRAAQDAQAEVKKTMEFFAKVTKGNSETVVEKGRDPDVVNAARAILAVYGIAPFKGKNAFEYMSLVQANDPQMFAVLDASVKAAVTSAKPVGQMTVDELSALRDEIDSMWHLAKASREYEVDGNKMDIADAGEELKNRMVAKGIPDRIPGEGHAVTESERAGRGLQFAGALLRRVEQWAEGMDGKFGGPFLRLVFQPVKEAANRYRTDRVAYREAFTKLVENLSPAIKPGLIEAPEIGYTFGKGKGTAGAAELTHAILHLGNESNKRKLLLGRQWATENPDGTLNTDKWDAFIKRMHDTGVIAKVHYDFAQGVWDLLEKMKPLAQKTHRDVFGRYFAEVTADVLSTPFGDYRGGYVPAQVDPEIVKDNEIRKLAEMENENMSYAFPSTNKGFTKSRTEYNRPLLLDIRALGQHMDKVLLFSHMEPAVRGVSKVLQEKGVAYSMNRIDPSAVSGMLTPWLNRSARQVVETPVVGDGRISRVLSVVRARAGMSVMFANVSNTLQQVAGLALAGVKVKPSHLASAMAAYAMSPKKMSESVAKASEFMAHRMDDQISALNGTMEEILLNPSVYESAQAWTQKHAYFLQSALDNVIGPVVWTGAYNQAIKQGMEEKDAVRFADGTIRQTQGSALPEDISRIETGPAYARVFTQFIGYFNMVANTNVTALQNIADDVGLKKGAGKALAVVFLGLLAPAWIAEAIALVFKGGPDDEDKDGYMDDWLLAVFGMGTLKTTLAGVPFVGQFAMAGVNTLNNKPYDDRTNLSPAVSMLEGSVGAPRSVYKALAENGSKQKAVRDVATAVSLATGLPASAIARPLGYLAGAADHKINPTSGADEARGLITGTASPQSKQQ